MNLQTSTTQEKPRKLIRNTAFEYGTAEKPLLELLKKGPFDSGLKKFDISGLDAISEKKTSTLDIGAVGPRDQKAFYTKTNLTKHLTSKHIVNGSISVKKESLEPKKSGSLHQPAIKSNLNHLILSGEVKSSFSNVAQ